MSAVAGCFWFDRNAAADDLTPSTACAAHRAGGPFHCRASGPVALAAAPAPPVYDPASQTTTIVDGIIDNLDEIAATLGLRERVPAVVARESVARWGIDAGAQLLGDFVIIVYDGRRRQLLAIRDPIGVRPLFYGTSARGVVLGSEAHQVARHPAIPRAINEPMIAEALTDAPATLEETLWRNVYRVPAGCALEVGEHGVRVRRYWDFDPGLRVRHSSAAAYADDFLERFRRALACRLPDDEQVGVFLSGGLDSSSIACVAQATRAARQLSPVHALTAAFPGRACDESAFVDAVVGKWRLPSTRVDAVIATRADLMEESGRYLDLTLPPARTAGVLRARARALGITTVLTGCGGDDYFSGSPLHLAPLLRSGRLLALARGVAATALSDRARARLRPWLGARSQARPWIRSEFARAADLEARLRPRPAPPFPTREQQDLYRIVRGLSQVLGDEVEERAAQLSGVSQRHPFYDRRLAEFGLALPSSQRMAGGAHKIVMRNAMREFLPAPVASRLDKAEFSTTFIEALEGLGGREVFAELRSEDAGWVDGTAVRGLYDRMMSLYRAGDQSYIGLSGPIWTVASIEIWLESVRA
jgi:asparagine synthase (glutamine-hydrolysing)